MKERYFIIESKPVDWNNKQWYRVRELNKDKYNTPEEAITDYLRYVTRVLNEGGFYSKTMFRMTEKEGRKTVKHTLLTDGIKTKDDIKAN